jgi:3-phenylpropionate/trans-cinnamate dioxygenase ferredoxin reductase subunit
MASKCRLIVNGLSIDANIGETLVDAALGGWTVIPHDCCSGQCETCRVNVLSGSVDDQGTRDGSTVLACTATLEGDAEIEFDEIARTTKRSGILTEIKSLAPDVVQLCVQLSEPMDYRPGQYFNVKFSGFPARDLSQTFRSDGSCAPDELIFHLRRYPGGLVSTQIGSTIGVGHRVHVRGPFGQAFLREGSGPIVLVSGGTGWAPIWSIAVDARRSQPFRDTIIIAGARDPQSLYMRESLQWLTDQGVTDVIGVCELGAVGNLRVGIPTHYLPLLGIEDTVYVAGPVPLVDAVRTKSRASRARCYADPFTPDARRPSLLDRVTRLMQGGRARRGGIAGSEGMPTGYEPVYAAERNERPPLPGRPAQVRGAPNRAGNADRRDQK